MNRRDKALWYAARALAHGTGMACAMIGASVIYLDMEERVPGEPRFWPESWWFALLVTVVFAALLLLAAGLLTKAITHRGFGETAGMLARAFGYGAIMAVLGVACFLALSLLMGSVTRPLIEAQRTAFWMNN